MSKYMTSQRRLLLDFLSSHPDNTYSAAEISLALAERGISQSAVYRNLSALEREGEISRVTKAGVRQTLYRYSHSEHCRECVHLNCEKCGRTYHMEQGQAEQLAEVLRRLDCFLLDRSKTVLYGICSSCSSSEGTKEEEK